MNHLCRLPLMINLYAITQAEYYALEELHDSIGIVPDVPICFVVEGDKRKYCYEKGYRVVYFTHLDINVDFPSSEIVSYIEGKSLYIKTDILGCIIQALSRHEEKYDSKDRYGRASLDESFAYKQGFHQNSYLDRLIGQFEEHFLAYLDSQGISWRKKLPSEKPIICLTHDVDSIQGKSIVRYSFWLLSALLSLKRNKIKEALNKIRMHIKLDDDPHFSFQTFYEMEKSCGFKSTFFLMSLTFFLGTEGRRYSLNRPSLRKVLRTLVENGWEVGLHPSRITHHSKTKLKKELDRLNSFMEVITPLKGMRNHFLRASFPKTWQIQEELGILYDSTLAWPTTPGFRAGTARPFRPFDYELNRRLDVWELPLIVMDKTLSGSAKEIIAVCERFSDECFKYKTPFTLLWHTDHLSKLEYPNFHHAYSAMLKNFRHRDCIGLTATEVIETYALYSEGMRKHRKRACPSNDSY